MASAENANDLGAPASGFGQNVTFAFKPGGVPDQQQLLNATPVEGGVEDAGTRPAMDHTVQAAHLPEDHTFEMLNRVAQEAMAPSLKAKRTEAYVSGMQAVAQGEAVNDIVQNQPWYSKIFGDSDVVAGARAYAGHAKAADTAAALEDLMPSMRGMSPQEAQTVFTKTLSDNTTGDAATDAQVYQSLSTQLPGLMRRQAKEHYGWLQAQAADAEGKSAMSGAKQLQAAAQGTVDVDPNTGQFRPGVVKPEEFAAQQDQFVKSMIPAAGRDLTNWQISTAKTLTDMAKQGLFHGLAAADKPSADGGPSLIDTLPSNLAEKLRDTWTDEEKAHRALNEGPYMKQIADIRGRIGTPIPGHPEENLSPDQASKMMQDVNSAYTAQTGSRLGIFTPEQMTHILTEGVEAVRKDRIADQKATMASAAAATKLEDKVQLHALGIKQLSGMLINGQVPAPGTAPAPDLAESWAQVQAQGQQTYIATTVKMHNANGMIDEAQAKQLQAAINSTTDKGDPAAMVAAYTNYIKPMLTQGGPSMLTSYLGDDLGKKMRVFDSIYSQGPQYASAAYQTAFVLPQQTSPLDSTSTSDKALIKDVKDKTSYLTPEWVGTSEQHGNINLRDDQLPFVAGLIKQTEQQQRIHPGDPGSTMIALKARQRNDGLQTLGGYAWLNPKGSNDFVHTMNVAGIPINKVAASLQSTIDEKAKQTGLDTGGHVQFMRSEDSATGMPQFVAVVSSKDGSQGVFTVDGDEISHNYKTSNSNRLLAADPEYQKSSALSRAQQQSREQAAAARNSGLAQ